MTPFELIDHMHHGRWDAPFPKDVQYETFVGFLREAQQHGAKAFLIKYEFEDEGKWNVWQEFTFLDDERCQAEALYLPAEDIDDKTAKPEGLEDLPVFDFEWPEDLDWEVPDDFNGTE